MVRSLALALFIAFAPAAAAQATEQADLAACQAMEAAFAPRKAEIDALQATRDAAAAAAETHGAAWEEFEVHRNVSARHAEAANREKAAYDEARKALARAEMALQASLRQYNADAAVFNARCTKAD